MEELAKGIYEGKIKQSQLTKGYIKQLYNDLYGGFSKGFGGDNIDVEKPETYKYNLEIQRNIYKFSCAKNLLANAIFHSHKGKSWNEFKTEIEKVNGKINRAYLQSEWETATRAGEMAKLWEGYKEQQGYYPNLKYTTQGDSKVRDTHASLNGIIRPIDDDFWKTHYPPNGWRCRCYIVQTAQTPNNDKPIPVLNDKDFPKEFRINVGISGQVYSEGNIKGSKPHPYFAMSIDKSEKFLKDYKKEMEEAKLEVEPTIVYKKGKGSVAVHPYTDIKDFEKNFDTAKVIVNNGIKANIILKEDVNSNLIKDEKGNDRKNPEYIINGKIAERKEVTSYTGIKSNLEEARKQGCKSIVYDLNEFNNWNAHNILRNLKGKIMSFKNKEWLDTIYFRFENKGISFTREELLNDYYTVKRKLESIEPK